MVEPAVGVGGGDAVEGGREGDFEYVGGARLGGPQCALELGPAGFDGREIGRIARQVKQLEPGLGQNSLDRLRFVRGQIVHQHGGVRMAAAQFGEQHGPQEGDKNLCGRGRRDAHGGDHPLAGERTQDGQPLPAARGRAARPLAARGTGVAAGHCGGDAGLVDKDQLLGVELSDPLAEDRPLRLDIGAVLLAGA